MTNKLHHKTLESYKRQLNELDKELTETENLIKGFLPKGYEINECPESDGITYYIMDINENIVDEIKTDDEIKQIMYDRAFMWLKVYNRVWNQFRKLNEIVYP